MQKATATNLQTISSAFTAPETNMASLSLAGPSQMSAGVIANITLTAASAKTFTADSSADQISAVGHGYKTGLKVRVSSSVTLPGGLAAATDYFVIFYDGSTIGLATSYANALLGNAIDITTAGSGTHTITPAAQSIAAKLQGSFDDITYGDIDTYAVTASGVYSWFLDRPKCEYLRVTYTVDGGIIASVSQQTQIYLA